LIGKRILLDTTYLLPFFKIPIDVGRFERAQFKKILAHYTSIHFAEISLYEVKAKLVRLKKKTKVNDTIFEAFWHNWTVLREDPKFIIEPYQEGIDKNLNVISSRFLSLDVFDSLILATAMKVGTVLTEDEDIHGVKSDVFFKNLRILSWTDFKMV